jgi:V/A-type H+/Na+-transporting ATPase subunit I
MIILFGARHEKNWGFRLFMGFLNLTIVNGLTSYLGDFLSYIRLMALGLVTAGIGVAINTIAFQLLSVPVAGILLLIIMLVFGHLFNIAISLLSGFVHTLRLHYVEFFPKFYVGGGRPFKDLKDEHKYVTIIE